MNFPPFLPAMTDACTFLEKVDISLQWNEHIIARNSVRFNKIPFESSLHEHLAVTLKDAEKTRRIWCGYTRFITRQLPAKEKDEFDLWLKDHIFLLGCRAKEHLTAFQNKPQFSVYMRCIESFFRDISCKEHDHFSPSYNNPPRKIAVITTSGGGGELMVATAIKGRLEALSLGVELVDIKNVIREEEDVLWRFTRGLHTHDIWSEIFQKRNNSGLADSFWWKTNQIRRYIEDNSAGLLKEHLKSLKPDLILTTRYFCPEDAALGYDLDIPLRFILCDYRFAPELYPLVQKVNSSLVQFWVPAPRCITPELSVHRYIKILGYPIRSGIRKMEDLSGLKEARGIPSGHKIAMMMMGRHGMEGTIIPLIKKFFDEGSVLDPLCIVIVCGTNTDMQNTILGYLEQVASPKNICFRVLGSLDEEEISVYYNLADVFIGKPGGCTTAELVHMNVKTLIAESYELERANKEYLIERGLGTVLNPDCFVLQLKEILSAKHLSSDAPVIDWQVNLKALVLPDEDEEKI